MTIGASQKMLALAVTVLIGATAFVVPAPAQAEVGAPTLVKAAPVTGFDPGNIIDDVVFFDANTMSADQIQSFLNSKVSRCEPGYTCLRDYGQATTSRGADAMCRSPYTGRSWESAASIIYNVAQACGINPRVLLVMLQKEQGLVTHVWPSDWRYTIAMGQGCPDTAACDTTYYGFFNQVYGAAWQLKRYANPPGTSPFFTWYAPGRTWSVLYNPNRNCGSSPVAVRNQATSNLYYYTPYQPNAAALAAGYGLGDGCSAYGNRNFYNYFTEWFGSVRGSTTSIVRTAARAEVYLVADGRRWYISDGEDLAELAAAFGPLSFVADSYISSLTDSGAASTILRDASSGAISLIQGGQTHRFATCESVVRWGGSCSQPTDVPASLLVRLSAGTEVGDYFRLRGSTTWGRFDSASAATPLYNEAAARAANGSPSTGVYAPFLPSRRASSLTFAPMRFAPAQLVRTTTDPKVYLTTDFDSLRWVPSFDAVADYQRTPADLAVVPPSTLSGYREVGTVAATLQCDGTTFIPAAGWLYRLSNPTTAGLPVMTASGATCAQFSLATQSVDRDLAVRTSGSPEVSIVDALSRRPVLAWSTLVAHNGGAAPPVLTVGQALISSLAEGAPLVDGAVMKGSGPDLQLGSGTRKHWIPSAEVATDLGISLTYASVSDARLDSLTTGDRLRPWVVCDGRTHLGASGVLYPVTDAAAQGFGPVALSPLLCSMLGRDGGSAATVVAVKVVGSSTVYLAQGGQWRPVSSWSALVTAGGGTAPPVRTVASLSGYPLGPSI